MDRDDFDPDDFDEGIRDSTLAFMGAGFKTFTSCEGGFRHAFLYATIGIDPEGDPARCHRRVVEFLRQKGIESFGVSVRTDYHPDHPDGKTLVYVESIGLLTPDKQRKAEASIRRRDMRALRMIEKLMRERVKAAGCLKD